MTVAELIEELKQHDPNRLVVMARDTEGNGYSPLYDTLYTGAYCKSFGEFGLEKLTDEDKRRGYTEEDVYEDGVPALCLYPTG